LTVSDAPPLIVTGGVIPTKLASETVNAPVAASAFTATLEDPSFVNTKLTRATMLVSNCTDTAAGVLATKLGVVT